MKEEVQVTLESKDMKAIVARALSLPDEKIVQLRYSIAVKDVPRAELERRLELFLQTERIVPTEAGAEEAAAP